MATLGIKIFYRLRGTFRRLATAVGIIGGKNKFTGLTAEEETFLVLHFTPRIRHIFSARHLLRSSPIVETEPGEKPVNFDNLIIQKAMKPSAYESFINVYDSGKIGRCLIDGVGMEPRFVARYLEWKREMEDTIVFDGSSWNEQWVYEIGGVRGAVREILQNF
ncbi:hypothetical protein Dda_4347 [Drechslerella dactyloides]|uniref:Uncharacterized protein n=1 Tax=Drechslerella dactyloides TaxID=74499 RepID=A0AAD6NHV0_DREDA|nr:hypothetical protein Dda_4347 [Drechslerella dactyloides]